MTPPAPVTIIVRRDRPSATVETLPTRARSRAAAAPGPVTLISPMWDRSKMPALVRTARCSVGAQL